MIYAFDEDVAKTVGVEAAVVLDKLAWWIRQNEANGTNYHEGKYWTYNSAKAMEKMFPFFNMWKIGRITKKLVDEGYLLTGKFNKLPFDKTLWYTLSEKGRELMNFASLDFAELQNDTLQNCKMTLCESAKPIPLPTIATSSSNIDIIGGALKDASPSLKKPRTKKAFVPPTLEEVTAYVQEKKLKVNPKDFFDYYEAGNWHDQTGKPVKVWKQKCQSWSMREGANQKSQPSQPSNGIVDTEIDWSKYDG